MAAVAGKTQRHYEVKLRWELLRSIESGEDVTGWKSEGYHGTGDITINEWFDIPCDFDKVTARHVASSHAVCAGLTFGRAAAEFDSRGYCGRSPCTEDNESTR